MKILTFCSLYFQLEIIQEGLHLKLDMHCAKEEFLGILEGYSKYDGPVLHTDHGPHQGYMPNSTENHSIERVPYHGHHSQALCNDLHRQEHYNQESSGSYRKARVKALYEERKARLHAKRERLESQTSASRSHYWDNPQQYVQSHEQPDHRHINNEWNNGDSEPLHTPDISYCSESDKESFLQTEDLKNNNTPTKSSRDTGNYYEYPDTSQDIEPLYVNMLSTITEENSSSSKNSSSNQGASSRSFESETEPPQIPPRCPAIPKERYAKYISDKRTPPPPWVELGEYVMLKDPNQSMVSFSENESNMAPPPSLLQPNTTNAFGGSMFSLLGHQSALIKKDCDNSTNTKESPVRYAKSDVISELYTSQNRDKSLLDISLISNISSTSNTLSAPHPHGLSDTTLGINPMHSTMIDAQPHSPVLPISLSETDEDSLINRTDDTFESIDTLEGDIYPHDQRTTVSEPSHLVHRAPHVSFTSPVRSKDDHCDVQIDLSCNFKTPNNPIPRPHCVSPKQTQIPQLCKEHGLHLNYGGPCIFEDSFDLLDNSDGSEIDFDSVNFNSENGSKIDSKRSSLASKISSQRSSIVSKRSSVMHPNSAVDTDCDSSYLSECVDDTHFTSDFSENYTAVYDSHKARMRMLRRQTGQRNIKQPKQAIGLSESDLFHDITSRHLSLQANRSSPPNIQGLSPTSSNSSADLDDLLQPDSPPLLDCTLTSYRGGSSYKESDDNSVNQTIISCDQRPVSLCSGASLTTCTTTDESPESNGGMSVPVNSPNITDSGGSSSKPTTDTYDYVDVPIDSHKVAKLLKKKLDSHGPLMGHHSKSVQSIPSTFSMGKKEYAPSISGSHKSYHSQAKTAYSDPVLLDRAYQYPQQPQKTTRYPRSQDSGFATHESNHKPRAYSMDPVHSPHLPADKPVQPVYSEQVLAHSCHAHSQSRRGHIAISDNQGVTRNVVQHSAVARNLNKDRKKALAKKLKQFNSNFYGGSNNTQIRTLGHF